MPGTVDASQLPVALAEPTARPRARGRRIAAALGGLALTVAPLVALGGPASASPITGTWVEPLTTATTVTTTWQEPGCSPSDPYYSAGRSVYSIGIDLAGAAGDPVRSIAAGVVVANGADPAWGTTGGAPNAGLVVRYTADDGTTFTALYGDVQAMAGVTVGAAVNAGQQIATVGDDAFLHLAVHPGATTPTGDLTAGQCPVGSDDDGFVDPQAFLGAHPATGGTIADGTFVSHGGTAYRIAGGAPLLVSSWDAFGGAQPATALTDAQWSKLALVPADGTFVQGAAHGDVYRIAGGAPITVGDWSVFGGRRPTIAVDDADFDHAGEPGDWSRLRAVPANGTFISGVQRGEAYRVAGGAPIFVSTWAAFGGTQRTVQVDDAAIDDAGQGGRWNHLRVVPANGTLVRSSSSGTAYEITSGHVTGTEAQGAGITTIDQAAITNAGTGGVWNHLLMVPIQPTAPTPVAMPTPTPTPVAGVGVGVGVPPVDPPAVRQPSTTAPPAIKLSILLRGHAVGHGWLCLAKTKHAAVRDHTTSVGGCVPVAKHGRTTITPRVKGSYYLVLVAHHRHVSPQRYRFVGVKTSAAHWSL